MSYLISISDNPDDMWMIKNSISWWFLDLVSAEYPQDNSVKEKLDISSSVGGIVLENLQKENPELSKKITDAIVVVAQKISDGRIVSSELGTTRLAEKNIRGRFDDLVRLMERFKQQS